VLVNRSGGRVIAIFHLSLDIFHFSFAAKNWMTNEKWQPTNSLLLHLIVREVLAGFQFDLRLLRVGGFAKFGSRGGGFGLA
jgi:hypothetical protein